MIGIQRLHTEAHLPNQITIQLKGLHNLIVVARYIVVESYKKKKTEFKFYYGGGLFPAKKYVYQYNKNKIDTLVFIPVETDKFDTQLDSLDKVILKQIDTLVTTRPKGSGLIYKVKQHNYKGYVREK